MAVTTTKTNKPINPRGNDQSPKGYNRASLFSGKALDFDGVNDSISVADSDDLDGFTNFTLHAIVKADTFPSFCRIFDKTSATAYNLQVNTNNNQLRMFAKGTQLQFSYVVPTGEYVHLCVAFTGGSKVDLFVNGQFEESVSHSLASIGSNSSNLIIGRNNPLNSNPWDGHISNAKIFDVALTAAQVADLYNNPEKIVPTGVADSALKLWLPMQEGAGTTAYDGSGNGNHGTISGATWTHGIGAPVAQTAVIDWNKGTNLLKYSEEFDNSSGWTATASSVTADDVTAPDGQTTADKLVPSATNANHYLTSASYTIASGAVLVSVFAKKGNTDFLRIRIDNTSSEVRAWFDLENGTVGTVDAGGTGSITDQGNGWYKCTLIESGNTASGSSQAQFFIQESDNQTTWDADGDEYIYLWGASVEQASSVGPYVRTGATAQTSDVLLPQGLTTGRDITGVNLFENVRKQGALNLDGNSWAEVHDNASLDITDAITLEAWVYNSGENNKGLLGRWFNGTQCYMLYKPAADNNFNFYINSNYVTSGTVTARDWHHVVGVYDGATKKIYVNGVEEGSSAETATINTSSDPIEIGRFYGGPDTRTLANQLAQPRIYNRALTAEEIERNYTAGKYTYNND